MLKMFKNCKKGFTLLELLVVVLIIGILAGIALPQYRFSVEKTRLSKYLSIGRDIRNAEEVFYMTNGEYSLSLFSLDIDIGSLCKDRTDSGHVLYNCNDSSIVIDNRQMDKKAWGRLDIHYCSVLENTVLANEYECVGNKRDLNLVFFYANYSDPSSRNKMVCEGITDKGKRLCKALTENI